MKADDHPIFIPNGFQINTIAIEVSANFILANIEQGHHGCSLYAPGGVGKTTAQQVLTDNVARWLVDRNGRQIGVAARMIMPTGVRRTNRAFWLAMNRGLNLNISTSIDPGLARDRISNFVLSRCALAKVRQMVLFIDNAQRIADVEYQYLEELDSRLLERHVSLFLVLVRQSDAEGVDIGDDWRERPSYAVRRWFMDTMRFQPITGLAELAHVCGRYDSVSWPTDDMPFSRFFARKGYDAGWRFVKEAGLIYEEAQKLRQEFKLPVSDEWPMATLTLVVRYLLTEIAWQDPDFKGFTAAQVRCALRSSGYLRLEFVRAKMTMPPQAEDEPTVQPEEAA
jgi:hypothetical protein